MPERNSVRSRRKILTALLSGCLLGIAVIAILHRGDGGARIQPQIAPAEGPVAAEPLSTRQGQDARESSRKPPHFTSAAGKTPTNLANDPNDENYDAVALAQDNNVALGIVFEGEPRDPAWAPAREKAIGDILDRDLRAVKASGKLVSTECHHSTCKVMFTGKTLEEADSGSLLAQYSMIGSMIATGRPYEKDGVVYAPFFVAYRRDQRDPEVWKQHYAAVRRQNLARARAGNLPPNLPPVPPE